MKRYLKKTSVRWAYETLRQIARDQSCLLFFLILTKSKTVVKGPSGHMSPFQKEFYRYFGAPLKGGGVGCFNPLDGRWMAEDYISSTVFGRLLNGSHWWTDAVNGFFERQPPKKFPADLTISPKAFSNLSERTTFPCLKPEGLLPMTAIAVWYYRDTPIETAIINDLSGLVALFNSEVIARNQDLKKLFSEGGTGPVSPYQESPLSEEETLSIYPPCPYSGEPKTNVLLYVDDVKSVKQSGVEVDELPDFFRKLIKEKGL